MTSSKTTFLLLRGLMREQRHWGDFVKILQAQFPEAQIITPDIPGNGCLYRNESPKTIAGMTEAIRAHIRQLAIHSQLNLIALSMGGMIALDWMIRYPEDIRSGVLINTSVNNFAPFFRRLRWQNYLRIMSMLRQNADQQEQSILVLTSNLEASNQQLLASWQAWHQQCPVSSRSALNQMLASARFKCIQKPTQPLLILTSTADRLVDYRCSVNLQRAWAADFAQHTQAGHDLSLDDPYWVSQTIFRWMNNHKFLNS